MNRLQENLGTLISTLVNNRFNNGLPSSDDGAYQPNFNLLNENNSSSFDSNTFFYIVIIIIIFNIYFFNFNIIKTILILIKEEITKLNNILIN